MKQPTKGDIWKNDNYHYLITDVARKTAKDELALHDNDFNSSPIGQKFIYAVAQKDNLNIQVRVKIEEWLDALTFVEKASKCNCPNCDKYHPRWAKYYN